MAENPFPVGIGFVGKQCFIANGAAITFFFRLQITSTCFGELLKMENSFHQESASSHQFNPYICYLFHFVMMHGTIWIAHGRGNFIVFT